MLARYMLSSCVCPSVCPSVYCLSWYCIETTGRSELVFLAWLPSTYPTLCSKRIWVSPKISILHSGNLSKTADLEHFATQVDRVVNRSRRRRRRRRSSLLTTPIRQSTSRGCLLQVGQLYNPLTPLLQFILDLFCNLFLQLTRFLLTSRVARSVCCSVAELLVKNMHKH